MKSFNTVLLLLCVVVYANTTEKPWFDWWGVGGNAYYPQYGGGFGSNGNYGCKYEYDLYRNSESCPDAVDVVFLMDSSGSISNSDYSSTVNFIKTVANRFYLHPNYAQISIIEFASSVNVLKELTYDACALRKVLSKNRIDGLTNIGGAIEKAHAILKNGRPGVPKHIILITDGCQTTTPPYGLGLSENNYVRYAANNAKADNIIIYSIGVGDAYSYESVLRDVATAPSNDHFSYIENYSQLNSILDVLTNSTCPTLNTNSDADCNEEGYKKYLTKWTELEKSTSRDPNSPEFKKRLEYYITSCLIIKEWNQRNKYLLEFTFYADWSAEEFNQLTATTQRYSGRKWIFLPFNQHSIIPTFAISFLL